MKLNNKGLSLVEVLVVLAILGILGGLMTMGISAAVSKPAEECAEKMSSALKNARLTTMGKQSIELKFYKDAKGDIFLDEEITSASGTVSHKVTKIGQKGVNVEYALTDGSTYTLDSNPLVLSFKRSSGGFNTCNGTGSYCEEVTVSKGSKMKILKLAYLTGKVTVE